MIVILELKYYSCTTLNRFLYEYTCHRDNNQTKTGFYVGKSPSVESGGEIQLPMAEVYGGMRKGSMYSLLSRFRQIYNTCSSSNNGTILQWQYPCVNCQWFEWEGVIVPV